VQCIGKHFLVNLLFSPDRSLKGPKEILVERDVISNILKYFAILLQLQYVLPLIVLTQVRDKMLVK
jgi:hypothetical protein